MHTASFLAVFGRFALPALLLVSIASPHPVAAQEDPFAAPQEQPAAEGEEPEKPAVPTASHVQTAIIKVVDESGQNLALHTFCLASDGKILAGVGSGPGQIRIYDADGKFVEAWDTTIRPEAINVGPDGSVYVAGSGKMLKFSDSGHLLLERPSPNALSVKDLEEKLRQQATNLVQQRTQQYGQQVEMIRKQMDRFKEMLQTIEDKGENEITAAEKSRRDLLRQQLEQYARALKQYEELAAESSKEADQQQIEQYFQMLLNMKTKISSISATETEAYLACPAIEGYGFEVWRMSLDFEHPTKIITDLRGCCGQMDVQACKDGLYVAENGRFRVCRYDREGKMLGQWGSREREGLDGFGSCCNPMNVAFGPGGEVFTAEASLGRIKRYSPDGELQGLIGKVEIVPGCKNVSIGVNHDGSRVYMLDMTRSHIAVMSRKAALAADETTAN
jgi:hypothetical protein